MSTTSAIVEIPAGLQARIEAEATRRGVTPAQVIADLAWQLPGECPGDDCSRRQRARPGRRRSDARAAAPARTPQLAPAQEEVASLSRREREVASLAAVGRSDCQIAETLFISVRTVNAHLRSVYAKLGVRSRHDLDEVICGAEK